MKKLLVVVGFLVLTAGTVWAHSLTLTATASCGPQAATATALAASPMTTPNVNGVAVISYTATSYDQADIAGSNPEIDILFNGIRVDAQAFTLATTPANQFSGTKPAPSAATVTVEAIAVDAWSDGFPGGQTSIVTVTIPTNCATGASTYYVDYYSNNFSASEQGTIRIVNVGQGGNPVTSPTGDICANIYVFNADQEMLACCAERLTPNELDSADVFTQLTGNTLQPVVPNAGVIKIVLTSVPSGGCNPTTAFSGADATLGSVWGTHPQRDLTVAAPGGPIRFPFLTESEKQPRPLSASEQTFLPLACSMTLFLGSGFGQCTSTVSGDAGSGVLTTGK